MLVTVHYLAQMKRAAGCASEAVEIEAGTDLRGLLVHLASCHVGLQPLLLDEENRPRKSLLFFVGDEHAGPAQLLHDGASVSILAPMAGG